MDVIKDDIWGELPRKRQLCHGWKQSSIDPIILGHGHHAPSRQEKIKMKWQHIGVKTFERHCIHYLHDIQMHTNFFNLLKFFCQFPIWNINICHQFLWVQLYHNVFMMKGKSTSWLKGLKHVNRNQRDYFIKGLQKYIYIYSFHIFIYKNFWMKSL
jgi:hypothetical protein